MLLNHAKAVQAKLVGSTMVISFRHSNPSIIWKYDLERNHSFTLNLQGDDGDFELGITSPKGEFTSVARFASREDADEAFSAVQEILMEKKWSRLQTVLIGAAGIFLLYFLYTLANTVFIGAPHPAAKTVPGPAAGVQEPAKPSLPQGEAVPADQVLQPPP